MQLKLFSISYESFVHLKLMLQHCIAKLIFCQVFYWLKEKGPHTLSRGALRVVISPLMGLIGDIEWSLAGADDPLIAVGRFLGTSLAFKAN